MVMYTINWSNRAEQYKPLFVELAEELKDVPDLIFASYDITENDPIAHSVKDFPAFVIGTDKTKRETSETFEGEITIENLKAFLEEFSPAYKAFQEKNKKEL